MTAKQTKRKRKAKRKPKRSAVEFAHQFLVVLRGTDPLVWRRIEVPADYSFWDLHVAIQDAMGWLDCHLHEFTVLHPVTGREQALGIPDEDYPDERPLLRDWDVAITEYFSDARPLALYVYDFGDDWQHAVIYEGTAPADPSTTYPRCLSGARACPPEDCGGVHRYTELLAALADPKHPEHEELRAWVGGHFDPGAFDPAEVVFDEPRERWKRVFED